MFLREEAHNDQHRNEEEHKKFAFEGRKIVVLTEAKPGDNNEGRAADQAEIAEMGDMDGIQHGLEFFLRQEANDEEEQENAGGRENKSRRDNREDQDKSTNNPIFQRGILSLTH